MARNAKGSRHQCSSCGHLEAKWLGRCPECGAWNSFEPVGTAPTATGVSVPLASIDAADDPRISSGDRELDRALGGGVVAGASVLIGGPPGIGKSTLLLQLAASIETAGRALYVSAEESLSQLKQRADRLGVDSDRLEVLATGDLDAVRAVCGKVKPRILVVDSLQTIGSADLELVAGTPSAVRTAATELARIGRDTGASVFLVAHVTKEGSIAGPRTVEHLVDTVLSFEDAEGDLRILRALKNRFGPVDEVGLFAMTATGLEPVDDPTGRFLIHRTGAAPDGVAIVPVIEGSRVLCVEVQCLVAGVQGGAPRVYSESVDARRVARIAAVLDRHAGTSFGDRDVYVNIAGGLRSREVGADLALALALYSARRGTAIRTGVTAIGELSLTGEVHPVPALERRATVVGNLGFTTVIAGVRAGDAADGRRAPPEIIGVTTIGEATRAAFGSRAAEG